MILSGKFQVVSKYTGKSKFWFWNNLLEGDIVTISIKLKNTGQNRGQMYAPDVTISSSDNKHTCSLNEMANYLSKIELKEHV